MWLLTDAYEAAAQRSAECYTDSCRMDESSFDLSVIDDDLWWALPAEPQGAENENRDEATEKYLREESPGDTGVTKILQYEWTVQLLFQLNGRFRAYSFKPAVFLQPVGRTTGDCFYVALQAQRSALGTESLRLQFKRLSLIHI